MAAREHQVLREIPILVGQLGQTPRRELAVGLGDDMGELAELFEREGDLRFK
jgi:hypothetical protein